MSLPPSRLFDYNNRHELDAIRVNAFASDGSERAPRIPAELLYRPFQGFLDAVRVRNPLYARNDPLLRTAASRGFESVHRLLTCVARRYDNEALYT